MGRRLIPLMLEANNICILFHKVLEIAKSMNDRGKQMSTVYPDQSTWLCSVNSFSLTRNSF